MSAGVRTVAGARWSCQGTGFCCRFHHLGPLSAAEIEAIEALEPAAWWPAAAEGWRVGRPGPRGLQEELRKVDGHCVFLDEANRCALHHRAGPRAKPAFCRLYPYQVVQDAQGIAVVVRDSCAGRLPASRQGAPMAAQVDEALALAAGAPLRWSPERVALLPGVELGREDWMRREEALLSWLEREEPAVDELLPGLRARLAPALGGALPTPDPARARLAARAVLLALDLTLARARSQEQAPSPAEAAFAARLHERIRAASLAVEAGGALPEGPEIAAFVRLGLAEALLGKDLHRLDGLFAGLGLFFVTLLLPEPGLGPDAYARQHAEAARFTQNRSIREVLRAAAPALRDLALHGPLRP